MELMKFFYLAMENNPAALEIIFTDPRHFLIKHPIMDRLLEVRHQFLSKKAVF